MDCPAPESQLLSFLVAGTLAPAERDGVLRHVRSCVDCLQELRDTKTIVGGLRELHLTAEEVVAAASGGARSPHLDLCHDCRADVSAVEANNRELAKLGGVRDVAAASRWRDWASGWVRPALAAAASVLLVSAILGPRIGTLQEENRRLAAQLREPPVATPKPADDADRIRGLEAQIEQLSRPQANAPLLNLEASGAARGESAAAPTIEFADGAGTATLVLHLAADRPERSYEVEIADARGQTLWRGAGFQKSEFNTFTLTVARGFLPAGRYRIRLYALNQDRRSLVETYALGVR